MKDIIKLEKNFPTIEIKNVQLEKFGGQTCNVRFTSIEVDDKNARNKINFEIDIVNPDKSILETKKDSYFDKDLEGHKEYDLDEEGNEINVIITEPVLKFSEYRAMLKSFEPLILSGINKYLKIETDAE